MKLIDTHCHLTSDIFASDVEAVLERAQTAGVERMITIGCGREDSRAAIACAEKHANVFAAVGLHPAELTKTWHTDFARIETLATAEKVVAIGETGLDFFRPENPAAEVQRESFYRHCTFAKSIGKPVIVHSRAAAEETLQILTEFPDLPFVFHCFAENWEIAERIFALGGMISFTGIVTFPKNTELQEVALRAPFDRIMIETDAPFLAPVPFRGKTNEPAYVRYTAEFIANLRGISLEEFAAETTANAERFFEV